MKLAQLITIITYKIIFGQCRMESYIIGGQNARIVNFPYSAFLSITCVRNTEHRTSSVCGSSIISQKLTLTAAHCTNSCRKNTSINVYAGHGVWYRGGASSAKNYIQHEKYDVPTLQNDICLILLRTPLRFGATVNRIALMKNPPHKKEAVVAGWGRFNMSKRITSDDLQFAVMYVKKNEECPRPFPGYFCTLAKDGEAAKGDSGSALVIQDYIQIGIVSFGTKPRNAKKKRVIYFTDTRYYYDWIQRHADKMACGTPDPPLNKMYECVLSKKKRP